MRTELLAVLDRPDEATRAIVRAHCATGIARTVEVDVGDLGLARNAAFAVSEGACGCTVDGDDLLSPHWMAAAFARVQAGQGRWIVHPEYVVEFGEGRGITRLRPMDAGAGEAAALLVTHPWTSVSLAPIEAYREMRYVGSTAAVAGFGYEDWHWNLEQLALGRSHVVAPRTALLYRKRRNSLLARQEADRRVLAPGRFFSPDVFLPIAAVAEASVATSSVPETRARWWARVWPRGHRNSPAAAVSSAAPRLGTLPAIPSWLVQELVPLSALEPELNATAAGLADRNYWEPQLRLGPGLRYAEALRSLRRCVRADHMTVCCSDASAAAAVREGREAVLQCRAAAAPGAGRAAPLPQVTILHEDVDGHSPRDADAVLVRLLLQLQPHEVDYEDLPRLRSFFDRYDRALRSVGVAPRPLAAAPTSPISFQTLQAGHGARNDHGTT